MGMTTKSLSKAQAKTLRTIVANGGQMSALAGQPGFYSNSVPALVRLGLAEEGSFGVKITAAGREAVQS